MSNSQVLLYAGGNYGQNLNYGLFYLNGNNSASNANSNIGSRNLYSQKNDTVAAQLLLKIVEMGAA